MRHGRKEMMKLTEKHCVPCEGGVPPLTEIEEDRYLSELDGWKVERVSVHKIRKTFMTETFRKAIGFVNSIADLAEEENHHPELHINYRRVTVELSTHAILGLSENDFIVAAKIDALTGKM
jgi:4a-hydroxytetrahydrobiopterin dehydratase